MSVDANEWLQYIGSITYFRPWLKCSVIITRSNRNEAQMHSFLPCSLKRWQSVFMHTIQSSSKCRCVVQLVEKQTCRAAILIRPWLLPPYPVAIKLTTGTSHEFAIDTEDGRVTWSRECYTLASHGRVLSLWTSLAQSYLSCGRWVLMFSVGNNSTLYNGEVKYQPKAQPGVFIQNDKLEAGKACMQH